MRASLLCAFFGYVAAGGSEGLVFRIARPKAWERVEPSEGTVGWGEIGGEDLIQRSPDADARARWVWFLDMKTEEQTRQKVEGDEGR